MDSGAIVLDGTDPPVEDTNPIPVFHGGVTRACDHGRNTCFPDEAKAPVQALTSSAWNNAYANFEDHEPGSLTPGRLADTWHKGGPIERMPEFDHAE